MYGGNRETYLVVQKDNDYGTILLSKCDRCT